MIHTSLFTMSGLVLSVLLCVSVSVTEQAELCTKVSNCSCRNSDGLIDLSPLASNDGAAYKDLPDPDNTFSYSWNPCIPFTEGDCSGVAGCQKDIKSGEYYSTGTQDSASFINDAKQGLQIQYTAGTRTMYVKLKCDRQGADKLDVKGEDPKGSGSYYMTLHNKYACPGVGGGGSGTFSIGTIVVIIVFSIIILYFVGGIIFQTFIRKESGVEIIPNYNFWSAVVGSIHDGVLFVVRCGKDRRVYSKI